MLVLTRKKNQSIMVGDIEVKVTDIRGNEVRIGITAAPSIPIHRKEVTDFVPRPISSPSPR